MSSRANLLRTLSEAEQAAGGNTTRTRRLAALLGFDGKETASIDTPGADARKAHGAESSQTQGQPDPSAPIYSASRPIGIWAVTGCEPVTQEESEEALSPLPEPPADLQSVHRTFIPTPPLRTPGQWQNLWDRVIIGHGNGRRIDLKRCLRDLSQASPIHHLPLLPRRHFNGPITVIIDRPGKLRHAFRDLSAAWRSLVALVGRQGLDGYQLRRGPEGDWERLDEHLSIADAKTIKPDAQVLLMGAFGGLESGHIRADWRRFIIALKRRGHPVHLLSVCPIQQPPAECTPLDPRQGGEDAGQLDKTIQTLLAALAHGWRVNEAQLRYLRYAIPGATLHAELRVANHGSVIDHQSSLELTPERLREHLEVFAHLPEKLRDDLDRALEKWRTTRNARAREMEQLQSSVLERPIPERFPRLLGLLAEVADQRGEPSEIPLELIAYLPLLNELSKTDAHPGWKPIFRQARRVACVLDEPLPGGYHPEEFPESQHQASRWLCQGHFSLEIRSRPERALLALGANPYSPADGRMVRDTLPSTGSKAEIIDQGWHYRLRKVERPPWAERIWQDRDGVIHLAHSEGAVFTLHSAGSEQSLAEWHCIENPWPWAKAVGADEQGLWAEFRIGETAQRLRWIPPGEFQMGSPEDEPERLDNEKLHHVTLTQGYWLAETACTQQLWQAVMGENPAHFKDSQENPVEQVSWDDCQRFIQKANGQLKGGLTLRLPTEAEWEYACRAGTTSPFSWGDTLTTDRANYDGNGPYNGGQKGEYRRETRPVRSFKPNPWGLYQMHGNVWEWCADWKGEYPDGPVVDPKGLAEGQARVLRGGGWIYDGRSLRSARRDGNTPDDRYHLVGLRLAGGSDPKASQRAAGMSADRRARSDRERGAQDGGEGRGNEET